MKPSKDESQSDFMHRCVPEMMGDGKREQDQAVAICMDIWRGKAAVAPTPQKDEPFKVFMDRCVADCMKQDPEANEDYVHDRCSILWEEFQVPGQPGGLHSFEDGVRVKTHSEEVHGMDFVLSDATPDRMGDIIEVEGWDLENFKRNPIALFNHNPNFPIGKWKNLRTDSDALKGYLELAPKGTSERIDEIRRLIQAGILKAVSVGFRPIDSTPINHKDPWSGMRFTKQELVETSLVAVPANPNALAMAKSLKISPATLDLVFAKTGRQNNVSVGRGASGKPAEIPVQRRSAIMDGLLAPRIAESEKRLNGYRDQLTEHLKNQNDENVSDADLTVTHDLNAKIAQEEKTRQSLIDSQKRLGSISTVEHEENVGKGTAMTIHSARPFALPQKKVEPVEYIWRTLTVTLKQHTEGHKRPIMDVLQDTYGEDEVTRQMVGIMTRAPSSPATIPQTSWAAEIVTQIWAGFMEALLPFSVFPEIARRGQSFTLGRNGVINLPLRLSTPQISGSFVGEGAPIPVRQGAFATAQLTPKKLAVISTFTREIAEHSTPAIEGLIREAILHDTAISLDSVLLDSNPATTVRPPGLLYGVTPTTATTAGAATVIALNGDIQKLIQALNVATLGNIRNPVWLMNPAETTAAGLAMTTTGDTPYKDEISRGSLMTIPIVKSTIVPAGTMILMDCHDYASVMEVAPRFDVSDQAVLHMEDTTPLAIASGSPGTVASPTRSLWQTDTIGIRMIMPLNWLLRRAGMVQYMTGMTWG
jgi:HK97 family phage prohead protease/HK97 family phage major capsid protein